jgi:hypothetical protein
MKELNGGDQNKELVLVPWKKPRCTGSGVVESKAADYLRLAS